MTPSARPVRLSTSQPDFETRLQQCLHWSAEQDEAIERRVKDILADVRARGDAAVLEYTARFDGLQAPGMTQLELSAGELRAAFDQLPAAQRQALEQAAARVRRYHQWQRQQGGETATYRDEDGTLLGQKITPLDRVGIYVPGGKASYPSSVLMNAIPAHVAGVGEIVMVVPTPRGEKNPLVLAAAHVAGVTRAFTIGGAQAVGALA
nr:histidinol dehydrogenase [Burkholderiaceae bacterium]